MNTLEITFESMVLLKEGLDNLIYLAIGNEDFNSTPDDDKSNICIVQSFSHDLGKKIHQQINEQKEPNLTLKIA